jgi:hypothetical protein
MRVQEVLKAKNMGQLLEELNFTPHRNYVLCDCPGCGRHEAFMYKNNPNHLRCNRTSNCGYTAKIEYSEDGIPNLPKGFKKKDGPTDLTNEQQKQLEWLNKFTHHYQSYAKGTQLDDEYRGLSPEVIKPHAMDLHKKDMVSFFFKRTSSLYEKDYSKLSVMTERNIVFAIKGDNNQIEALTLRSTINPNLEPKEIHIYADPRKQGRDFVLDLNPESKHVAIGESIMDGLSFKEIDPDTSVIGLTGTQKLSKMKKYIEDNQDLFKDKSFLIAMDDDVAGKKANEDIKNWLNSRGFKNYSFDYQGLANDPNEFLQKDKQLFKEVYETQKRQHLQQENIRFKEIMYER